MGEVEPRVVKQLDMGESDIDTQAAVIPAKEKRHRFMLEQTSDGSWSRFEITTTQRTLAIEPGIVGQDTFDDFCDEVADMYATPAGQKVLARMKAFTEAKPLEVKVNIGEVG